MSTPTEVAQRFYRALADGDGQALFFDLLTDDFEGVVSAGMPPHGVGGEHHGRVAMISDVWGPHRRGLRHRRRANRVPRHRHRRPRRRPRQLPGSARTGAAAVDAAFAHVITVQNEQITALQQITDTVRWQLPS